jgi:hypothetical protein
LEPLFVLTTLIYRARRTPVISSFVLRPLARSTSSRSSVDGRDKFNWPLFVLTTLIYRSQLNLSRPSTELRELVERARGRTTVPLVLTDGVEQFDHTLFRTFEDLQNVIPFCQGSTEAS